MSKDESKPEKPDGKTDAAAPKKKYQGKITVYTRSYELPKKTEQR
jgi:hypothetical protein